MTGEGRRRLFPERRRRPAAGTRVLALVPHFRCERWLEHCLASLVGQTRPPDGIVVIDDASSQPPEEIVRRFPGVTLVRAAANVGPYRLIQQVIDDTAYDHYLFQDADDWSAPSRLQCLLAAAERTGAELIGSDYLMFCTDEVATLLHTFPIDVNAALAEAPTCHALQHPTSLVSRSLVTRLDGYASGMRFSGDDEFLRRAAHVAQVVNVPEVLYFRRHRAESLTTSASTGHGSPARRDVLRTLAARAQANADALTNGGQPRLEPYSVAPPVELEHVCGPAPDGGTVAGRPSRRPARRRWPTKMKATAEPLEPVLVVGGLASGADALLWSLAQHPATVPVVDVTWLGPLSKSMKLIERPADVVNRAPSVFRHLHPPDVSGTRSENVRSALTDAVRRVLLEGPTGPCQAKSPRSLEDQLREVAAAPAGAATCWVAAIPPDPERIRAVLAFFPGTRVIHLVRNADDVALALARRSKSNPDVLSLTEAYQQWLVEVRHGLAVERAVGSEQLLRLHFDDLTGQPDVAIRRCLAFAGLDVDAGCVLPLEQLDLVAEEAPAGIAGSATALELSTALCGPPGPGGIGIESLDAPLGTAGSLEPIDPPPQRPLSRSPRVVPPMGDPPLPAHVAGPAALVKRSVPAGAVVAAVTKGEGRFLDLESHVVWHFPRTTDGEWAGYHPASCDDVVRHLDQLVGQGARYFLIPSWALWWLDHYKGLREHLERRAGVVAELPDAGIVFDLGTAAAPDMAPAASPLERRIRGTSPGASGSGPKRSVSVVAWNTVHNPLGRAHVLAELLRERYDVELVGAEFEQFGSGVWPPLLGMDVPLRSFPGGPFPEHFARMEAFAETITSDAVVVSKPRLPSYLLGIMAKALRNRPLILDVDDREATFVGATEPMALEELERRAADPSLLNPYGSHWTRHCEALVGSADHVTVSNDTLQSLFGGTILPHARDERVFDPARFDRSLVRRHFGFQAHERIVLFAGTPRRHKGVVELAASLREVGDPRARLCLIGTSELESLREDLVPYADLIRVVDYQPFGELPALLAACDMVAVLQDPDSDVSQYQMPAKITDALAMARPCLVRSVPPLRGLVADGHLQAVGDIGLAAKLGEMLADEGALDEQARVGREVFLEGYSFSAVRPRLEAIVERLLDQPPPLAESHRRLLAFGRQRFGGESPVARPAPAPASASAPARHRPAADDRFDIVMFWKQNDTGIYGRRHDMLMNQLVASERVGQVVQFDAPVDVADLRQPPGDGVPHHAGLVRDRTMQRIRGIEEVAGLHQYSFVYTSDGTNSILPGRSDHLVQVKEVLTRHRIGDRPVVFWVYPKSFDFPEIARALGPDVVVADVVDDHRSWARPGTANHDRIVANYREIAELSDITFTNCEPMKTTMEALGGKVHLVPNAAEYPDPCLSAPLEMPEDLRLLKGPIIGYVGNLSSRIDVELLEHLATSRPQWNLVLVGSAHAGQAVLRIGTRPNVSLLGPRPYEEAKRYVRAFDVGMIPHLDDDMTSAMHPLKAFVYTALGVPVVSTDIANLGELRPFISVASDHADFVAKVDAVLSRATCPLDDDGVQDVLRRNCWQVRTEQIVGLIGDVLHERGVAR